MKRLALILVALLAAHPARAQAPVQLHPPGGGAPIPGIPVPMEFGGTGSTDGSNTAIPYPAFTPGYCVETFFDASINKQRMRSSAAACGSGAGTALSGIAGDSGGTALGPVVTFASFLAHYSFTRVGNTIALIPGVTATPTPTRSPTPTITRTPVRIVGDCTGGDCFGETRAQSDCVYFGNDGAGNRIRVCPPGIPTGEETLYWPLAYNNGVVVVSCLPPLYCIDGQIFLATPSPTRTPTPTPTVTSTAPTATATPSGSADCTGAPTLACLNGRTGGQSLFGGDTAGDELTLGSESTGTAGVHITRNGLSADKLTVGTLFDPSTGLVPGGILTFVITTEGSGLGTPFGAVYAGDDDASPTFFGVKARTTLASPTESHDGDSLLNILGIGYDSDDTPALAAPATKIGMEQDGAAGVGFVPGSVHITTMNASGTPGHRIMIRASGKVGIGTDTPATLLDVAGDLTIGGAPFLQGAIPTCGTNCASLSATSNDRVMDITVSAGVITAATVNFSATLSSTPICTASTNSATVGGAAVTAVSTTAVTFGTTATIGGGHIYAHCFEAS